MLRYACTFITGTIVGVDIVLIGVDVGGVVIVVAVVIFNVLVILLLLVSVSIIGILLVLVLVLFVKSESTPDAAALRVPGGLRLRGQGDPGENHDDISLLSW